MRPTPRLILIVFLLTQVFDGILTYVAVSWLGVVGEGNLLLATAMKVAGAGPALFGAKTLAAVLRPAALHPRSARGPGRIDRPLHAGGHRAVAPGLPHALNTHHISVSDSSSLLCR